MNNAWLVAGRASGLGRNIAEPYSNPAIDSSYGLIDYSINRKNPAIKTTIKGTVEYSITLNQNWSRGVRGSSDRRHVLSLRTMGYETITTSPQHCGSLLQPVT
jgi:hypothetical protein